MKPQLIVPAIVFAAIASLSFGAHAEDAEKAPAPKKMMKFHPRSHLVATPKTDQAAAGEDVKPAAAPPKEERGAASAQKNANHFHPRDGGK